MEPHPSEIDANLVQDVTRWLDCCDTDRGEMIVTREEAMPIWFRNTRTV